MAFRSMADDGPLLVLFLTTVGMGSVERRIKPLTKLCTLSDQLVFLSVTINEIWNTIRR